MIDLSGLGRAEAGTVVLVGAGAVANSWAPVLDALGDRIPRKCPHSANVYFATLVHRLRWLKTMTDKFGITEKHRLTYVGALEEALAERREITDEIATSLRSWDGNKLRPEARILRERLFHNEYPFAVVSTNWDFSAGEFLDDENHDRCCGIGYLHGTYEVGLYLPGEVADEFHRGPSNRSEFSTSALNVVHLLRDASLLVVYGLSISPLDAELGFLLQAARRQRMMQFDQVLVVDPNHRSVIQNLSVHLRAQNYFGVAPSDLRNLKLATY